jgi:hypothetical protein
MGKDCAGVRIETGAEMEDGGGVTVSSVEDK